MEFNTYTLSNGIRCIHKQVKSGVVHCALTINTGSRDELPGEYGMAHLVEHTLFKGTKRRKAWQVNCRLENMGGELNAYTTKEETVVHATTLRGDYAKAVELIADIVFNSTFPEHEIEKEKNVIFDEINLYKDSPTDRIYDEFEDMIYEGSSLGHNILGSKTTLRRLHSTDIKRFIDRTYTTDQMVFSIIGNISEKSFRQTAERYFGGVAASRRAFSRMVLPLASPFERSVGRSTHQVHYMAGNRAYDMKDDRRIPLLLLINTLGGPSANSLLNVLLREKNALSYGVEASYTPFTDSGIASVYFSCEKENAARCTELINRQISELVEHPLSPRRLSVAKRQFLGQLAISAENNESYMLGAAKSYLVFGDIDGYTAAEERIGAVTAEDMRMAAEDIFSGMSSLSYK